MGKSSKAPEYAKTTTNTGGLFGSSTSDKSGTSFTGEDWQTNMGGLGSNLINQSLQGMATNDYSNDPNFKVYQDNFNRQAQQAYDANVLNPLANRGLMRSSGLQAATNSFNKMQLDLLEKIRTYMLHESILNVETFEAPISSSGVEAATLLKVTLPFVPFASKNAATPLFGFR